MNTRKPFDVTLFRQNDKIAREAVKKAWLNDFGYRLEDNPDVYGPDLMCYQACENGDFIGFVEVEIKQFWKEHSRFPDDYLHIPERKRKFFRYGKDGNINIVFCVLSADLKGGYWIHGGDMETCSIILKPNKYMEEEYFFNIPLEKMSYFSL